MIKPTWTIETNGTLTAYSTGLLFKATIRRMPDDASGTRYQLQIRHEMEDILHVDTDFHSLQAAMQWAGEFLTEKGA